MADVLFVDDLVVKAGDTLRRGTVKLTHEQPDITIEVEQLLQRYIRRSPSIPPHVVDDFMAGQGLPQGVVLVDFYQYGELLATHELILTRRLHHIGDIVKKDLGDAISGTVINTITTCDIQPLCTYVMPNGLSILGSLRQSQLVTANATQVAPVVARGIPLLELRRCEEFNFDCFLLYHGWVGNAGVMTVFLAVRLCNSTVVEVAHTDVTSSSLEDGLFHVGDLVTAPKSVFRQGHWIFGSYNPNITPCGTVVNVRYASMEVDWIHKRPGCKEAMPPSVLERQELESPDLLIWDFFRRPTPGNNDPRITNIEPDVGYLTRVRFFDAQSSFLKHPNIPRILRDVTQGYDMNVFDVVNLRTRVSVLWQDDTISEEDSIHLSSFNGLANDEHSAWVGEVTHTVERCPIEGEEYITAPRRVGIIQAVDAEQRTADVMWCGDADVRFASIIDDVDHEPGAGKQLVVGQVGVASGPIETVSLYDMETSAALNVCRADLVFINDTKEAGVDNVLGLNWFGSIIDERSTGELVIRLCAADPVRDVVLRREQITVAIRLDDWMEQGASSSVGDVMSFDSEDEEMSEDEPVAVVTVEDEDGNIMEVDELDVDDDDWESFVDLDQADDAIQEDSMEVEAVTADASPAQAERPPSYQLHEQDVPQDHRFVDEPDSGESLRMRRIQKEHRIFHKEGAIPPGVFVHSWESRLDLLRVLIIGPQDTPYADAPFVVDFYLPDRFPFEPPKAFFHSWTGDSSVGGLGPVNPNLYEDGTICLSLLGTWSGQQRENWAPSSSTLLQVIVSILGLVLVKEPYYNEAGHEEQIGTLAAQRPSMLYTERIVLRVLDFAIAAVIATQNGRQLSGTAALEPQIAWLYTQAHGGRLMEKLVARVQAVLARSEQGHAPDGLNVLTKGGCMSLRRGLQRLQELMAATTTTT